MKTNSKFWQGFLVAGITALAVPTFVQGQTAGSSSGMNSSSSGSVGTHSGTSSGMSPGVTGSSGTHSGSTTTNEMTGSSGSSGMSSSMSGANRDVAGNEADQQLNSQIRQGLSSDTSLAGATRNVQLTTQDGQVTLNGTVSSEAEKL